MKFIGEKGKRSRSCRSFDCLDLRANCGFFYSLGIALFSWICMASIFSMSTPLHGDIMWLPERWQSG